MNRHPRPAEDQCEAEITHNGRGGSDAPKRRHGMLVGVMSGERNDHPVGAARRLRRHRIETRAEALSGAGASPGINR